MVSRRPGALEGFSAGRKTIIASALTTSAPATPMPAKRSHGGVWAAERARVFS